MGKQEIWHRSFSPDFKKVFEDNFVELIRKIFQKNFEKKCNEIAVSASKLMKSKGNNVYKDFFANKRVSI